MDVPLKTKSTAIIQPCNPTPRHISTEKPDLKGYVQPHVHCSTAYHSQDMETT